MCGSGISDGLANRVLVKTEHASSTPRESLATNLVTKSRQGSGAVLVVCAQWV